MRAAIAEIKQRPENPQRRHGSHAVVIGASMAGLLAARVLADFYGLVTILERDALDQGRETRKGVPQGRHVHVVLVGGANAIQSLLPGFFDELTKMERFSLTSLPRTYSGFTTGCSNSRQAAPLGCTA